MGYRHIDKVNQRKHQDTSKNVYLLIFALSVCFEACFLSCGQQGHSVSAPWGDSIRVEGETAFEEAEFDLDEIVSAGELIVLTVSGPDTYYDYHGVALGAHALLCQQLADTLGVRLRIEPCRDTAEVARRLAQGEADLAACPMTEGDTLMAGWRVAADKPMLRAMLCQWYSPRRLDGARKKEQQMLSAARGMVRRRVASPMLNRSGGIISDYDASFRRHSQPIRWDWRLMAAQCYQESAFDARAVSWAGAKGLMQIMPGTADHLGLAPQDVFDPEQNIAAAARYLSELEGQFSDIRNRRERQFFVLAAYNGGTYHIRDAMALARRDGRFAGQWREVEPYVLKLSQPAYYQDTLVKHGYMRGNETVEYVRQIIQRYRQYQGVPAMHYGNAVPRKSMNAKHRGKFTIKD